MPPPEPRSRTVSPALSFASAVGFPQPSEADSASAGIWPDCAASYRFDVIGSQPQLVAGVAPQHELPPVVTRSAALPYFSFTASRMFGSFMMTSIYRFELRRAARRLYFACNIQRREIAGLLAALRCSRNSGETCSRG